MGDFWNAADLSADLGFGRNMPPRFWKWCEKHGLKPRDKSKPLAFHKDDVDAVLRGSRGLAA